MFTLIMGFICLTGCGQLDARLFGLEGLLDQPSTAAYPKVLSVNADVTGASSVGAFSLPRFTTAQVIPISVNFTGPVDVTGTPTLELETGSIKRKAHYASGSGTNTLIFEYSVVAGDSAATLDYTGPTALDLNGGTITAQDISAVGTADEIANIAKLPAPGATNSLADTTPILIRTIPEVKEFKTPDTDVYLDGTGLEVVVKYDQPVTVTGSPSMTVKVGSNNRVAHYIAQISASELLFRYEIIVGDDDVDGIEMPAAITMAGATIVNPANEPAVVTLPTKDTTGVLTYTTPLTAEFLSSSQIVSETAGDIYVPVRLNAPAPIPFKVAIQVSGEATSDDYTLMTPELNFAIGEQAKTIHIKILNDTIAEPEKRIRLMLSKNALGAGGVRAFHEIHINDDDGGVTPTITDYRAFGSFWCALYSDKTLKCWGSNTFGQMGNNSMTNNYSIPTAPVLTNVESFDVKQGTTVCAVRTGGELWCWGRDNAGALSGVNDNSIMVPTKYINSGIKKVISLPRGHAILDTAGDLWAWGTDKEGLFSTSNSDLVLTYANRIKLMGSVQDFWFSYTGNYSAMCALNTSKDLYCWGDIGLIGLPIGVSTNQYRVPATPVASNVESFSLSRFHGAACVVKKNGAVNETYCWGENYYKFLNPAASTTNSISTPTLLSSDYKEVYVTQQTVCGIKDVDSSLWCWGKKGDLPDTEGATSGTSTAQKMIGSGVRKFLPNTHIDGASVTNCVLMTDGSVQCWGNLTTHKTQATPILVKEGVAQVSISRDFNYKHACATTISGSVDCWGKNTSGQVGDRTVIDRVVPTEALARNQKQVSASRNTTCSVSSYGEVRCWGFNESGAIGLGGAGLSYTSPQVLFSKDVKKVQLDERGGCALKNNGSLWCWGSNTKGQYRPGSSNNTTTTPFEVRSSGVKDFTTRLATTCLITDDQELFCWGSTDKGATGQGASSSPVLNIPTTPIMQDVASVAIGGDGNFSSAVCAVKTNGDMHCWGQSSYEIDLGSLLVPSATPNLTDIKEVFLEVGNACVIQGEERKLVCWGTNSKGLVGNGQTTAVTFANRKTIFASGATSVSIGPDNACAVADEKLYCWGDMTSKLVGVASSVVLPRTVFGLSN